MNTVVESQPWNDPLRKLARRVNLLTVAVAMILCFMFLVLLDSRNNLNTKASTKVIVGQLRADHDSIRADIRRYAWPAMRDTTR